MREPAPGGALLQRLFSFFLTVILSLCLSHRHTYAHAHAHAVTQNSGVNIFSCTLSIARINNHMYAQMSYKLHGNLLTCAQGERS